MITLIIENQRSYAAGQILQFKVLAMQMTRPGFWRMEVKDIDADEDPDGTRRGGNDEEDLTNERSQ